MLTLQDESATQTETDCTLRPNQPDASPEPPRSAPAHRPRSVGVVQRQVAHFRQPLPLRSGGVLDSFSLAYETYGTLNASRSNAILVCHALSGDAHAAGYHTTSPDEKPGWWDDAIGPGKIFDTERYFVICSNVIGGCQGSTGPASLAPDGRPYALRFPNVTIADMVEAQRHLLDYLGIERLLAVTGGSMGGMQALQWAVAHPARVGAVLFLASTARTSPMQIAFNESGRQAIYADPNWNGGDYYAGLRPEAGLAVARMMAHITYMSETSMEHKFGRRLQDHPALPYTFSAPEFAVESYLTYQGRKFVQRFDANSYLYITKAIDYFNVAEDYGALTTALARVQAPFLVVSFSSDWLYTRTQAQEVVEALRSVGRPVEYHHIDAPFGHDSFLVEVERMAPALTRFLRRVERRVMGGGTRRG